MEKIPMNVFRCIAALAAAALLSFAPLAAAQAPTPLTWKLPEGARTIEVNGYPMAYVEAGSGPTVVLVHGVMCDMRCWSLMQRDLVKEFRFVAVSLRHFYPENWNGSGDTFTAAQHAKDLAAFLERMNPPVFLLGHSNGGVVAAETARARPELVSKLVLAEGATDGLLGQAPAEVLAGRKQFSEWAADNFRTRGTEAGLEAAVDSISGPGTWSRFPERTRMFHRDNAWTIVGVTKDPSTRMSCEQFGSLRMPVLLLTGEDTPPRYKQIVAAQAKCLPAAKTVVIPNAGHASLPTKPQFDVALREFLK